MNTSVRDLLQSSDFRHLVGRRWRLSLLLTALLFVLYYGYVILIATNPGLLSRRVTASRWTCLATTTPARPPS